MLPLLLALALSSVAGGAVEDVARGKAWRRLLHYDPELGRSEITDPAFFLSPRGATDPEAELRENLRRLAQEQVDGPQSARFACRFPARQRFLQRTFGIIPRLKCPTLEAWRDRHAPESVTYVYASQYVGNPASLFGHTFLRFDRGRWSNLLGLSLAYFAQADQEDHAFTYAYKGLTGGYAGRYTFDDYYPKARLYGSSENRDMWEYTLAFTEEERLILLEHAHELSLAGRTPYYFLDKNCAFRLLEFLDVAREKLELSTSARGRPFLTPQDSLKILARAGLVKDAVFRPSLRQRAEERYGRMDKGQKRVAEDILLGRMSPEEVGDPAPLSAVGAILAMREAKGEFSTKERSLFQRTTNARAKLPATPEVHVPGNGRGDPLGGHDTHQLHLGLATTELTSSLLLGIRPAAHSLDDRPSGLLPNTQVLFLEQSWRVEDIGEGNKLRLRQLTFMDVKSLSERTLVNRTPSWTAQLALMPTVGSICGDCRTLRLGGSYGVASALAPGFTAFVMGGPTLEVLTPDEAVVGRAAPTALLGIVGGSGDDWRLRLESRLDDFLLGPFDHETLWTTDLGLTWLISPNQGLTLGAVFGQNLGDPGSSARDASLRWTAHF